MHMLLMCGQVVLAQLLSKKKEDVSIEGTATIVDTPDESRFTLAQSIFATIAAIGETSILTPYSKVIRQH